MLKRFTFIKIIVILLFALLLMNEECQEINKPVKSAVIAPNPAIDKITLIMQIENETALNIGIFDMNGEMLLNNNTSEVYSAGEHRVEFNISQFISGTYLCKIDNENSTETIKFLVSK